VATLEEVNGRREEELEDLEGRYSPKPSHTAGILGLQGGEGGRLGRNGEHCKI